jgi:hypothetical protein
VTTVGPKILVSLVCIVFCFVAQTFIDVCYGLMSGS